MSDQFNLFETQIVDEESLFEYLQPGLLEVLDENAIPHSYLKGRKNKTNFAVVYRETVVFTFKFGKSSNLIIFPGYAEKTLPADFGLSRTMKDGKLQVKVESPDSCKDYAKYFMLLLDTAVDRFQRDYSCCSRYMECSQAGKCINPHPEISMECRYKTHLKHGENFFMKNPVSKLDT